MSGKHSERANGDKQAGGHVAIETPVKTDGGVLWRIARDSKKLDLNSSYAYLLWCHDFAETSVVAKVAGEPVGFVLGYRRPQAADTAVVWQVAVDGSQQGRGLAGALLDALFTRLVESGVRYLETTVTPDNKASIRLFESFAQRWYAAIDRSRLFDSTDFPDEHEAEELYRIGPLVGNREDVRVETPAGPDTK